MISKDTLAKFTRNFWLTLGMIALFSVVFFIYVRAEKNIDRANEIRFKSYVLADELRQSSDDLTRMARTYVTGGGAIYKKFYEDIDAIREGKMDRPNDYHEIYWDLVLKDDVRPRPSSGHALSFSEQVRQAGFSEAESSKLAKAKENSDALALIERDAMKLYEQSLLDPEHGLALKMKAIDMLNGERYHQAKAAIMWPIYEFYSLMENRTLAVVHEAESIANQLRALVILICFFMLVLLWRAHQKLQFTLGANAEQLREYLDRLGQGDFSEAIIVAPGSEKSVLGLLSVAQAALARVESERSQAELRNERLTQFYSILRHCNQAIVRSRLESELFQQICRDTVNYAGIRMAWIGVLDTHKRFIFPLAAAGDGIDILNSKQFSVDDGNSEMSCVSAVREGRPVWCQDLSQLEAGEQWKAYAEQYFWGASASIPLFKNGEVYGVINLFASGRDAFDDEIQALLVELAMDLSFALNRFELELGKQRSRKMESLRSFMFEQINAAIPLDKMFHDVVGHLEELLPTSMCSIGIISNDGKRLDVAAAPSLPDFYAKAIDGVLIGEGVGSCGHAAYTGERTIVESIAEHANWILFKDAAAQAGLVSCWSEPIRSSNHSIIGAFAIYYPVPSAPDIWQIALLEMTAHLLAIAIDKSRAEGRVRMLTQALEQSPNVVIVTDADARIEYVNAAFVAKTGRSLAEVVGKRPNVSQSGKTSLFTYEEMWESLRRGEKWQGELVNRSASGEEFLEFAHISPVRDVNGKITHFLSVQEDITDKKRTEERIQYLAHYDVLTGLPNRVLLEERTRFALSAAKRNHLPLCLVFFDLDHFKHINDSLGHSTGDALLVELSRRLRDILREGDTISRLGGDEFILVLSGADEMGAERVAKKLLQTVNQTYHIGEYDLTVSASIGIAMYPDDGEDLETLLRNADTAMYRAKQDGRNSYRFFTQEMEARTGRHLDIINALRFALERNQLSLVYQPQIELLTGRIIGTEALLRWQHPELGMVSPAEFIPVAEETGLILSIGEWVMHTAIQQTKRWQESGWHDLGVAVNLSAIQFRHADLPGSVTQVLREAQLDARYLELELTEGVAMGDPHGAIEIMNDLHRRGVRLSIDDFGTGYSSLSYLKKFKVSKLKIDRSFVRDINSDPEDRAIVGAVISMAKRLGLRTIAEGVESADQLSFLCEQGCDEVQGFYFARPLSVVQFEEFMLQRQKLLVAEADSDVAPCL